MKGITHLSGPSTRLLAFLLLNNLPEFSLTQDDARTYLGMKSPTSFLQARAELAEAGLIETVKSGRSVVIRMRTEILVYTKPEPEPEEELTLEGQAFVIDDMPGDGSIKDTSSNYTKKRRAQFAFLFDAYKKIYPNAREATEADVSSWLRENKSMVEILAMMEGCSMNKPGNPPPYIRGALERKRKDIAKPLPLQTLTAQAVEEGQWQESPEALKAIEARKAGKVKAKRAAWMIGGE